MLENPIKEDIDSENDFKIQFILFGVWCLMPYYVQQWNLLSNILSYIFSKTPLQ